MAAEASRMAFERWKGALTPKKIEELTQGLPGPKNQALKYVWAKQHGETL